MAMTISEKILSRVLDRKKVSTGEIRKARMEMTL
jgi:hypothetical protein